MPKGSENETVKEIVREMRNDAIAADAWHETHGEMASAASTLNRHADRIESAWRREKKPKRNCDRFATLSDAKESWFEECCKWFGGNEGCGGTYLKKNGKPDFDKWLFAPVAEGGES